MEMLKSDWIWRTDRMEDAEFDGNIPYKITCHEYVE
jgi:hypothetical protein